MKPKRFHGLKRPKLRQTWNKYNLYNIFRMRNPKIGSGDNETFFQQKWRAKGMLRGYHGEHVVERKWERMFSRRLLGVADMDARYMAEYDGSEMAAGRGSGKDDPPEWGTDIIRKRTLTPYMQMTFSPMERRLDIAVFRAMFASSARQAKQFCVHGAVKVNGKVMHYPAYRLNPGDMFQVDPDRVMYATGAKKKGGLGESTRQPQATAREDDTDASTEVVTEVEAEAAAEQTSEPKAEKTEKDPETTDAAEAAAVDMKPTRKQIQDVTAQVKAILADEPVSVQQKQNLRKFIKNVKPLLSRAGRANASPSEITDELSKMMSGLNLDTTSPGDKAEAASPSQPRSTSSNPMDDLTKDELKQLEQRMAEHIRDEEENPVDFTKPYATPWRPRPYMSPFAFIPKYLEVNQNVCAAVYLRHPVARVGSAEVPTPYNNNVSQLAFNWYLRRR
ncbi:Uu.00g053190.m01.CDS01 [Anthostomella pinea]|uniref:Small ribosomal subunit protein uS4m n=1 Tax=Anthostomella pinea TaxID=933095 RepID=A0AAI8YPE0_9PEZI|nr:Uu.00g053190.m01.CDS01 [Anthostomella pinea]